MTILAILVANLAFLTVASKAIVTHKKMKTKTRLKAILEHDDNRSSIALTKERLRSIKAKDNRDDRQAKVLELDNFRKEFKGSTVFDINFKQRCFSTRNIIKNIVEVVGMNYQLGKGINKNESK